MEQAIRNVSDTARWAALYRARETERENGLFRDPFAARLAGERGRQIAEAFPFHEKNEWAWIMRTVLFDRFILERVAGGADVVANLAAGLDARPYRADLPASLRWVEVDLPDLLAYKEEVLAGEKPVCSLERVRLDLADASARKALFASLCRGARKALVITEGLLIYLTPDAVGSLARDLAAAGCFTHWVLDIVSPGLLRMLQRDRAGSALLDAGAAFKFAPDKGPAFFARHGWRPVAVESPLKAAAKAKRLSFWMRVAAMLPEPSGRMGNRPWSGVCLMERQPG